LPHRSSQNLVARPKLAFHDEASWLARDLGVELLRKVENVFDYVDLPFYLLVEVDKNVDGKVTGQGEATSEREQVDEDVVGPLDMDLIERDADRASNVRGLPAVLAIFELADV